MANTGGNFFTTLLEKIFASNDPAVIKKRKLKTIAKNFNKSKFNKFYKAGTGEALPSMAKFFFEIYKAISPLQTIFKSMQNEARVKQIVIEAFQSEKQKKLAEILTEENILAKAKQIPVSKLVPQVKDAVDQFFREFDAEKITAIENLYEQFLQLKDFCTYDYYFLLKKFDAALRENNFSATPHFQKINADYIAEDLKDFIIVAWSLPLDADWTLLLSLLKNIRSSDAITPAMLKKTIARIAALKSSRALEMIIQLISKDPLYFPKIKTSKGNIADAYLDKFKIEIYGILRKLEAEEKGSKVSDLLKQIFGSEHVSYLKNYTQSYSANLEKRNLKSFAYSAPLSYLKGFLLEFVKKDIRQFCDLVLVRGQWTAPAISQTMSNAYNDLLGASDTIATFDANLAEDASIGIKIKTLLPRTVKEADARNIINRLVGDANDLAKEYITECSQNLITMGKIIKNLIEDEAKRSADLINNWKELERFSDTPPKELASAVYKKIYLFATLIQTCMKNPE